MPYLDTFWSLAVAAGTQVLHDEQNQTELRINKKLQQLMPSDCRERCTVNCEVKTGDIAPAISEVNKDNLIVLGAKHKAPLADHMPRGPNFRPSFADPLPGAGCASSLLLTCLELK